MPDRYTDDELFDAAAEGRLTKERWTPRESTAGERFAEHLGELLIGPTRQPPVSLVGTCGVCGVYVERTVEATGTELVIGPWRHRGVNADDAGSHEPARVDPL